MRKIIVIAFLLLASNIADAQLELIPTGNWWSKWPAPDSIFILAPIGSKAVDGAFFISQGCNPYLDTATVQVEFRQDSLYGNGFDPESVSPYNVNLSPQSCTYNYNFSYLSKKYEDTSVIQIRDSFKYPFGGQFGEQINVIAITYIAPSNQYSLSRSIFDTLRSGDTEIAILRIFNQTPDTEYVSYSLAKSDAFTFLDSVVQPILLAPGDSLIPIRLHYLADAFRLSVVDSISLSYQRIRDGLNYRSPGNYLISLSGFCATPYYRLSKTEFDYYPPSDSSIGTLSLYNSSQDSESVIVGFMPQGDFTISGQSSLRVSILPHDSSGPLPVVMHASINRNIINDTVVLNAEWDSIGAEVAHLGFKIPVFGRSPAVRFSIDTILHPVYTHPYGFSIDSVIIHNLSADTLSLNSRELVYEYFDPSSYTVLLPPHQTVVDERYFQPSSYTGTDTAVQLYTDNFGGTVFVTLIGVSSIDGVAPGVKTNSTISVYPNPSVNEFQIRGMESGSFFLIYDVLGNPVFKSITNQDVWDGRDNSGNHCRSGQYFAVVMSDGNRRVVPIILAH
jgi:hypothetical protein